MAKKMTSTDIENKLQALIGLRYFTQEALEFDEEIPLGNTIEYVDKQIGELIAEKYRDAEKTKKAAVKKEPAKKAAVKKVAAKKEPAKKAAVKKAAAKKEAPAKKVAAKKEPVKKAVAKKEAVKKAPAKKAKK